jgi:hypothetical protein
LEEHSQSNKLQQLKSQLSSQQSLLFKRTTQAENSIKMSYHTVRKIARHGKPFVRVTSVFLYVSSPVISNISLLKDTTVRQIDYENIFSILKCKCLNFVSCSVAMDKSKDATRNAQLAIFIHGVNENCKITGCLSPPKGQYKGI